MKILLSENPFAKDQAVSRERPAWVTPQRLPAPPEVTAYRLRFNLAEGALIRAHVSADERYLFYVNGQLVGRGPERGCEPAWFYETYELDLPAGAHILTALVWRLGELGPLAHLLQSPGGWNFSDWAAGWSLGTAPGGFGSAIGLLNWHLVYTLGLAMRQEEWAGEAQFAQRWREQRDELAAAVKTAFWDGRRGLFADDLGHTSFCEHTQCLALLSGVLKGEQLNQTGKNLLADPGLTRTTIYFTHYLFEAYCLLRLLNGMISSKHSGEPYDP